MLNKDRLNNPEPAQTTRGTFVLLDDACKFPAELQLLCPAILVVSLCQALKMDPVDVMAVATNFLADRRNQNDERMKALDYYIRRNILKQPV